MTRLRLIYLTVALLLSLTAGVAKCFAQEPSKTVQWIKREELYENDAVSLGYSSKSLNEIELEDISIDGKSIAIGDPFKGDFRNLRFRVKNISDKPIDTVQIDLLLPEIKHFPLILLLRTQYEKEGVVQPGQETVVAMLEPKVYDWVKDAIAKRGMELKDITKVAIYMVSFSSREGFSGRGGCVKTRDPRNECPAGLIRKP